MLTFNALRAANRARVGLFKNAQGKPAHAALDGSDWSIDRWFKALVGELGEWANISKKVDRGDFPLGDEVAQLEMANELADAQIYLDLLAFRSGVDLGAAVMSKFNYVSDKQGLTVHLREPTPVAFVMDIRREDGTFSHHAFWEGPNKPKGEGWRPLYEI